MYIKRIINQYNDQLEEPCEIGYITEPEKKNVGEFLRLLPNLNADDLFIDFLFTYFAATSGNIGLYGYDMINELDEPPISDQNFLGFCNYSKDKNKRSISSTFFWDLTGERTKGVYCRYFLWVEQIVKEQSEILYFCNTFAELLDIIFRWEIDKVELEDIYHYIKKKYEDSRA
jgi:hypothetical protein